MFQLSEPSDMHFEKKKKKKKTFDFDRRLYVLFLHPWKLNIHIKWYLFDNNFNHEYIHLYSWCFKDDVQSYFS